MALDVGDHVLLKMKRDPLVWRHYCVISEAVGGGLSLVSHTREEGPQGGFF